jgi:hypothetical protein
MQPYTLVVELTEDKLDIFSARLNKNMERGGGMLATRIDPRVLPKYVFERLALLKLTPDLAEVPTVGRGQSLGVRKNTYIVYVTADEYTEIKYKPPYLPQKLTGVNK